MEVVKELYVQYGWQLSLIAIAGVVLVGILKYSNAFKKQPEQIRHYIYVGLAMVISMGGAVIYLAINKQLTADLFVAFTVTIYALNQTFYNLYKVTPLKDLFGKLFTLIFQHEKKETDKK